ncbi:succinyldiaminopimelate aminotransferase apoenzyme [Georgenia satyanarayanai]|uniref:Aminotransferase n=1 Tax=Georgenia satyanarayanai TaxID=860221 RepID=A0A2Y9C0L9_9MICO|nr:succinyldiaminopimelate transaminase [Georgenia satyanarayanai]PYF96806.1 succinyldiaminopimelate aminotransferase [Georgenia satyanarayanai]SSA46402.1 succinyldiaminopimelate aminotransferase apoenzyme [Georgenia satyanarayanai]
MALFGDALPSFPWDSLAGARDRARAHPDGIVDLSVGTPVDPTPQVVQDALVAAADSPGYPTTQGTERLRESVVGWFARRRGVPGLTPEQVLPTIGSKELVALLPAMLGLGAGDVVVHPQIAYPTYDVGARLAGAEPVPADATTAVGPGPVRLVWLNSPSNPTGRVLGVEHLRKVVDWARARGAVVASDECYAELGWAEPWASEGVPSLLDPRVCGDSHEGLLVLYSASKQSNLAGYRAAFAAGDPALVGRLLELRKHAGMIMPAPVQAALAAAMDDDEHVAVQRERYRARREVLLAACSDAGLVVAPESEAGLYLWATTAGETDCREIVAALAERGILVAPGEFYGPAGARHVRIALTASDERVAAAAERLSAGPLLP